MITRRSEVALIPRNLVRTGGVIARLPVAYARSAFLAVRQRELFGEVQAFCLFLGYPRSGHSIFGALLDAHSDIVIGRELNVLTYVRCGFTRSQIYHLLLRSSRERLVDDSSARRYHYGVPGQWQGRWHSIRVIGDKMGMATSLWAERSPGIIDQLRRRVAVPLKVIHVTRNPFDNIATMLKRRRDGATSLERAVHLYLGLSSTVARTRSLLDPGELFDVRHEDLIASPKETLRRLCGFLGVEAEARYVESCAAIVYDSPHRSRHGVEWTAEALRQVSEAISREPHLHGYGFDD